MSRIERQRCLCLSGNVHPAVGRNSRRRNHTRSQTFRASARIRNSVTTEIKPRICIAALKINADELRLTVRPHRLLVARRDLFWRLLRRHLWRRRWTLHRLQIQYVIIRISERFFLFITHKMKPHARGEYKKRIKAKNTVQKRKSEFPFF